MVVVDTPLFPVARVISSADGAPAVLQLDYPVVVTQGESSGPDPVLPLRMHKPFGMVGLPLPVSLDRADLAVEPKPSALSVEVEIALRLPLFASPAPLPE